MIEKKLMLLYVIFTLISCRNASDTNIVNIPSKDTYLDPTSYYEIEDSEEDSDTIKLEIVKAYNQKNCLYFLDNFPRTFEEFLLLFGIDDNDGPMPLYDQALTYIDYFFQCWIASDRSALFCLNIIVNGTWEPDAVNYFQKKMRNLFVEESNFILNALSQYHNEEIQSIFYFILDGPHPRNNNSFIKELLLN